MTLSVCAVSERLSPSQVTLVGLLLCHFAGRQSAAFQKQNMSFPALLALEVSSGNLLSFCHTCFTYLRYQCPAIPILMHSVYFLCGFYYNTVWGDLFWSWPQASSVCTVMGMFPAQPLTMLSLPLGQKPSSPRFPGPLWSCLHQPAGRRPSKELSYLTVLLTASVLFVVFSFFPLFL